MSVEIIPAILSRTIQDYHKKFKAVEPYTEWVQIDIVDNKFARNFTIGPKEVKAFRTLKKLEIHLMVKFIEDWIDPFINVKVKRIVIPYESSRDPIALINHLRRHKVEIGFSLNPETGVERLQHIIDKVDNILLLSVHPGFSGQHFVISTFDKIRKLRGMRPDIIIEVDGGIEPGIARKCVEVGANILAVGSFIFENDTIEGSSYQEKVKNAIEKLREDISGVTPILEG